MLEGDRRFPISFASRSVDAATQPRWGVTQSQAPPTPCCCCKININMIMRANVNIQMYGGSEGHGGRQVGNEHGDNQGQHHNQRHHPESQGMNGDGNQANHRGQRAGHSRPRQRPGSNVRHAELVVHYHSYHGQNGGLDGCYANQWYDNNPGYSPPPPYDSLSTSSASGIGANPLRPPEYSETIGGEQTGRGNMVPPPEYTELVREETLVGSTSTASTSLANSRNNTDSSLLSSVYNAGSPEEAPPTYSGESHSSVSPNNAARIFQILSPSQTGAENSVNINPPDYDSIFPI